MKELFKNPELVKKFKLLHYILLSNGMIYLENDIYIGHDGDIDYYFNPYTNKGSATPVLPDSMLVFLDTFFETLKDNVLNLLESGGDERGRVTFTYNTSNKKFTIDETIFAMDFESSVSEFEIDEKELLEDMLKWREEGKDEIRIDFNGSGDSGYIDDYGHTNDNNERVNLPAVWEDKLYNILERNHGGWEINEGSEGTFTINNAEEKIELDFRMNVETEATGYEFEHQFEF
jgi:hypothetical protein